MKRILIAMLLIIASFVSFAQDNPKPSNETEVVNSGFKKQNLFTGGSLDVGLSSYTTELGIAPVLGYSVNRWLDAGLVFNVIYQSERVVDEYGYTTGEKLRSFDFGPGAFARIYPVDFLFVQAQFEENFINYSDIYNGVTTSQNVSAPSLLLGAGYCLGRQGGSGEPFFYIAIMADVIGNKYSPYVETDYNTDGSTSAVIIPVIKAGIQIPLFQGPHPSSSRPPRRRRYLY
jgi:hypothetical protein